jgi:RNA polymerase sigma factor (TIGR02999 family)
MSPAGQEVSALYDELRRLARSYLRHHGDNHSLQPTALVHEAYLRLETWHGFQYRSRAEFFGAAASVMRSVLATTARRRRTVRRGSTPLFVPIEEADGATHSPALEILELDMALTRLAVYSPDAARVVEVRVFGGLSIAEASAFLDISPATVKRHWVVACAWLYRELRPLTSV